MKQSTKKALWRGLSGAMCFTMCLSIILGNALEANAATIDTYLGTSSEVLTSENNAENPLYDKFTPPCGTAERGWYRQLSRPDPGGH